MGLRLHSKLWAELERDVGEGGKMDRWGHRARGMQEDGARGRDTDSGWIVLTI